MYAKKYNEEHSGKNLDPQEKKLGTKSVLCQYFAELKERESQSELVPACADCQSIIEVVSVKTADGLKLLCAKCREKLYERPKKLLADFKCDYCGTRSASRTAGTGLHLCEVHYGTYKRLAQRIQGRKVMCELCDQPATLRDVEGRRLCAEHRILWYKKKRERKAGAY